MATNDQNNQDKKKRYHRVVLVMGRNATQDFFTRVLTALVRIGLKNDDGMAPPALIMKYMSRMTQRSVNDKGLRTRVGRALQRAMENGLVTLKRGHFKLTRRAGVVADTKGKLWLKIPTLLPPGQATNKRENRSALRRKRLGSKARPKTGHHAHHHRENACARPNHLQQAAPQQQQNRQIQTNMYLSRPSAVERTRPHACPVSRPSRALRPSRPFHTPSRTRSRSGHRPPNPVAKCGSTNKQHNVASNNHVSRGSSSHKS